MADLPEEVTAALNHFADFVYEEFSKKGANGYIIFGKHRILKTDVVIKTFYREDYRDQEPAILAACETDNVVRIYDARFDSDSNTLYYLMERCDSDVSGVKLQNGSYVNEVLDLIKQVLCGISFLHSKDPHIVHRDIKPDNILIKDGVCKICDLGSAAEIDNGKAAAQYGSILYRPPESVTQREYTIKSDIYQIGVVAYSLLGGQLDDDLLSYLTKKQKKELKGLDDPFDQSLFTDSIIEDKITRGLLLKWRTVPQIVPNKVVRIIKKATHIDPDKRYGNAAEFLGEIQNIRNYCNCKIAGQNVIEITYDGKDYIIKQDGKLFTAFSSKGKVRRITTTKSKSIDECFGKLRSHVNMGRDE